MDDFSSSKKELIAMDNAFCTAMRRALAAEGKEVPSPPPVKAAEPPKRRKIIKPVEKPRRLTRKALRSWLEQLRA